MPDDERANPLDRLEGDAKNLNDVGADLCRQGMGVKEITPSKWAQAKWAHVFSWANRIGLLGLIAIFVLEPFLNTLHFFPMYVWFLPFAVPVIIGSIYEAVHAAIVNSRRVMSAKEGNGQVGGRTRNLLLAALVFRILASIAFVFSLAGIAIEELVLQQGLRSVEALFIIGLVGISLKLFATALEGVARIRSAPDEKHVASPSQAAAPWVAGLEIPLIIAAVILGIDAFNFDVLGQTIGTLHPVIPTAGVALLFVFSLLFIADTYLEYVLPAAKIGQEEALDLVGADLSDGARRPASQGSLQQGTSGEVQPGNQWRPPDEVSFLFGN